MKTRITRKEIYNRFGKKNTICVGDWCFNAISQILEPNYFHAGVFGWNADIFVFNGFCIVSGYRPFGTESKEINKICENANNKVRNALTKREKFEYIDKMEEELYNLINK